MKITVQKTSDELILHAQGRIDTYTSEEFEATLMQAIEDADCIRLDFTDVEFISSAGLRALLNGQKQINEEDKEMIISNINDVVESVFISTGFMSVLTVE